MVQYHDIRYEYSDSITNEVLRQNNSNKTKQIIFTSINLGLDALLVIANIIALVISYEEIIENCDCIWKCCCYCFSNNESKK